MTNIVTLDRSDLRTIARLGLLIGVVAALVLATQADTFARERDEQPEDRPGQEEPRDPSVQDDPADNGNSLEDNPADNGNSLEEDPADNDNSLQEVELDPIVFDVPERGELGLAPSLRAETEIKEEIAFAYKTIKFND